MSKMMAKFLFFISYQSQRTYTQMRRLATTLILLVVMLNAPLTGHAISGNYPDSGGGQYWCNVEVATTSAGKSYGWLTGDGTVDISDVNDIINFILSDEG